MNWSARPFLRIAVLFATGILIAYHYGNYLPVKSWQLLPVSILCLVVLIFLAIKTIPWGCRHRTGLANNLFLMLLGFHSAHWQMNSTKVTFPETEVCYLAQISRQPTSSGKTIKALLNVRHYNDTTKQQSQSAKVLAYFQESEAALALNAGDHLLFKGKLSEPRQPMNPHEFNYASFLALKGIRHTVYLRDDQWKPIPVKSGLSLRQKAGQIRNHFLETLQEKGISGSEYAVAAAVLLGYDELMEPELEQDFINAGAMHILCVSGLHVGVIYLVVNFLLSFLKGRKSLLLLKVGILLLVVWGYALVTGLAPSVQRASVMVSLFIIGNSLELDRDPYNTLAASAVLLMVFDPMILFNVGFQLSYAAVFGILTFHNPFYRLIVIHNKVGDKVWSVFILSIAAQLGAFPIAVHYFHFFPTWFWISNLFIFPLSFVIIAGGFIFLLLSWIPFVSDVLAALLSTAIWLLNYLVGLVRHLPGHGLTNLYFPWIRVVLVYGLAGIGFMVFLRKKIQYLIPLMVCLFMLAGFDLLRTHRFLRQQRLVVYSINKHTAIDFIEGRQCYFLADSLLLRDLHKQQYHLGGARVRWGVKQPVDTLMPVSMNPSGPFYYFQDWRILVVHDTTTFFPVGSDKLSLDLVVLTGHKKIDLSDIAACFSFDQVVIDASVPAWKRKKLIEEAEVLGIGVYDVGEEGAYQISR